MDHTTLGVMFQEITMEFSQMKPTTLDQLENRTLDAIYKLGEALMQWKLEEWNTELHKETCSECGSSSKLENRYRGAQIATWVADIHYDMLTLLNSGDVDGALEYIQKLLKRFRKKSKLDALNLMLSRGWQDTSSVTEMVYGMMKLGS